MSRRLWLEFAGDVDGDEYGRCMAGWLGAHPEAVAFDWIYDLRAYTGRVSHGDVACFGHRYREVAGEADRGARSVFVTPDAGFRFWVQACQLEFPHRAFAIVTTLEEAEAALLSPAG
jgi:hypothetical protein